MIKFSGQRGARKPASEWSTVFGEADGDMIIVKPKADIIARLDAELVA